MLSKGSILGVHMDVHVETRELFRLWSSETLSKFGSGTTSATSSVVWALAFSLLGLHGDMQWSLIWPSLGKQRQMMASNWQCLLFLLPTRYYSCMMSWWWYRDSIDFDEVWVPPLFQMGYVERLDLDAQHLDDVEEPGWTFVLGPDSVVFALYISRGC